VVAQVAVTVAALPVALAMSWQVLRMGAPRAALAADSIAAGIIAVAEGLSERERGRITSRQLDLIKRLEAEPAVARVTFSSAVPGFAPGRLLRFVDSTSQPSDVSGVAAVKYPGIGIGVGTVDVAADLFAAYDAPIVAGRNFDNRDVGGARGVIVNESFVRDLLTDPGRALGVRFRYDSPYERPGTSADTAYEIIGIVRDFPGFPPEPGSDGDPTVYHPTSPGAAHPLVLSVRFAGEIPADFADRFRVITGEVDPALQVIRVAPLAVFYDQQRAIWRYLAWGVGLLVASVLMLSAAGIYAMIAFTVAQRTREIAIRSALGAAPHRLLMNIFGRAGRQLGTGLIAGSLLGAIVLDGVDVTLSRGAALTGLVACLMIVVGFAAALGPARRGLHIRPSEALRADT
jgi:hypothetical protein